MQNAYKRAQTFMIPKGSTKIEIEQEVKVTQELAQLDESKDLQSLSSASIIQQKDREVSPEQPKKRKKTKSINKRFEIGFGKPRIRKNLKNYNTQKVDASEFDPQKVMEDKSTMRNIEDSAIDDDCFKRKTCDRMKPEIERFQDQ